MLNNGFQALTESGLKTFWFKNEGINSDVWFIDYIFETYKNLGNTSKARPIKKGGSYMLALANGQISSKEYEPLPKSIYVEGAKYISGFLAVSALTFIWECVAGKRISLQQIKWLYWSFKIYGRQYCSIFMFKIKFVSALRCCEDKCINIFL